MQQAFKFTEHAPAENGAGSPRVKYDFPAKGEKPNGLVLVGEAPGAEEVRLGHPFVGRSGQLLDKMLAQAGINRKQCLVANVFRFQPPGNKVDHFFISRRAAAQQGIGIAEEYGQFGSAWCRAEFAGELEHLRETLENFCHPRVSGDPAASGSERKKQPHSPRENPGSLTRGRALLDSRLRGNDNKGKAATKKTIILALGRTPMWALTGENGLLEKIGKPLPCRVAPGINVIPTFHPSFILRGNWGRQDEWLGHFVTALGYCRDSNALTG